jgi:TRAP-type mannitol/chloroaromatic compound transport system permease small subunit
MGHLLKIADVIDAISYRIGHVVKWLAVSLVLIQFVVVLLRYAYSSSFIWMQESVIYVHATLFMMAIGYTYLIDAHVRVDVFYARWSSRAKALADLIAVLVTVLPFCVLIIWSSWGYVVTSWRLGEGPMAVGGLPLTSWLKSLIPLMAVLLGVQALSIAIRAAAVVSGWPVEVFPRRPVVVEPV